MGCTASLAFLSAAYLVGVYQIGDDQARSWTVAGTSGRSGKPARTAS
jgi:hypothetical protein